MFVGQIFGQETIKKVVLEQHMKKEKSSCKMISLIQ